MWSYHSLSLAPHDPSALYLVHIFHSNPDTPSVPPEALLALPCLLMTNSRLKPLGYCHGQAFATWTTSLIKTTASPLAPIAAASILFLSLIPSL
ncbi:unnamed protein product [Protopolystoma xenopodis]|uniref:Uncharacterized protein n=1 Tax=Protopolystoma xenopodis TaxID=117903 RepID=A0A448XK74_9PLAT|nr:unnamed protein product [Protopolystoma xenopodis]